MPQTIFFSWQLDTVPLIGRNLIERALKQALVRIEADTELEEAVRELEIDRDTKGVAGSPPIVDTIFKKIDAAAVFLPDLTFVGKRLDGRPTPNPNVLIEYGWALKSLTHGRMVPVMNTAFGGPTAENMPFDMQHLRRPILYHCPENATEEERRQVRDRLSRSLEEAIRNVFKSVAAGSITEEVEPIQFTPQPSRGKTGIFRGEGEPLGVSAEPIGPSYQVYLSSGPSLWLRVMPLYAQNRLWSIDDLHHIVAQQPMMRPLNSNFVGVNLVRGHDGFGSYVSNSITIVDVAAYLFCTGEIWSVDNLTLKAASYNGTPVIIIREQNFRSAVYHFGGILRRMGVSGPLRWAVGVTGVIGRPIFVPIQPSRQSFDEPAQGYCMLNDFEVDGIFEPDNNTSEILDQFFNRVYDVCGVRRPDWLKSASSTP